MAHYGINEVLPGLFIGSRFAVHLQSLATSNLTHLLSVDNFKDFPPGYITKSLDIDDEESEDILRYFEECIEFMKNHRVLVFCTAGRSRSATIMAAYLMKTRGMGVEQALSTIKQVRRVKPNPGFMVQLHKWEGICCELCTLERRTEWIEENDEFVCMICEQCDLPMVCYREHTNIASEQVKGRMRDALGKAADRIIGGNWFIDTKQRSVFNHLHWHARPNLFKL